jgi:hypothetical protein
MGIDLISVLVKGWETVLDAMEPSAWRKTHG